MPRRRGGARATRIERGWGGGGHPCRAVVGFRAAGCCCTGGRSPSLLRHGSSRNNRAGSSEAFVAAMGLRPGGARLGAGQGRRQRRLNEAATLPAFLLASLFGPVRWWHFTLRRPPSGRCAMDHHAIAVPVLPGIRCGDGTLRQEEQASKQDGGNGRAAARSRTAGAVPHGGCALSPLRNTLSRNILFPPREFAMAVLFCGQEDDASKQVKGDRAAD